MAHIQYVDTLIREYMLFRGFAGSLKSFDAELKTDKDKGFRVDKLIEHITHAINVHDLAAVRDIWSHLDGHLFSKLEHSFTSAVKKLECGILKLYLVTAFAASKSDKITEFFTKLAPELHSQTEWKEWFFFPFCKNPEENPIFAVCFSKQWQDTLLISLHNFLATIFQCMPQPTLTRADTEASLVRKLQDENCALRARLQSLSTGADAPSTNAAAPTASAAANNLTCTHQSRLSSFQTTSTTSSGACTASGGGDVHARQTRAASTTTPQSLADIVPFDVTPPTDIVDDFYIIAMETLTHGAAADGQARGLRSLIKNIGAGAGSPVLGRKESLDRNKRRSGSTGSGRSWTLH